MLADLTSRFGTKMSLFSFLYWLIFSESLSQLKFFIPKQTQPRGQPFSLVLAEDFSIDLQMFLKNTETSMKFSFNPVVNCADLKADAPAAKVVK